MRTIICASFFMIGLAALAQLPPYQRNPITTNSPAGMTNQVIGIIEGQPDLVLKSLIVTNGLTSMGTTNHFTGVATVGTLEAIEITGAGTNALYQAATNAAKNYTDAAITIATNGLSGGSGVTTKLCDTTDEAQYYVLPDPAGAGAHTLIKTNAAYALFVSYGTATNEIAGELVYVDCVPVGTNWFIRY